MVKGAETRRALAPAHARPHLRDPAPGPAYEPTPVCDRQGRSSTSSERGTGRIRWLRLSVTAGQDQFQAIADLQSQIDYLAAEIDDQEARITALEEAANADVVTIYKAVYNRWRRELKVEAISGDDCDAMLTLVGYGPMECDKGKHKYKENGVPDPGKIVTVESSLGGSDTHRVIHWGWYR